MISWEVLFGQTASVVAVIMFGWILYRIHIVPGDVIRPLCRLVLDFTLPALIFTRLVQSVPADTLAASWPLPLLGAGLAAFSQGVCHLAARWAGGDTHKPTLEFCATFPNWFYLPLAVLEPVFGFEATRILILFNIGFHAWIWTVGILPFGGEKTPVARRLLRIFVTPPFVATAAGIAAVLLAPWLAGLGEIRPETVAALPWPSLLLYMAWNALAMTAEITIPLTLLTVGAQLASATFAGHGGAWATVWGVSLRLLIVPALTLTAMAAALAAGWRPGEAFFLITFLVAAMPTAVVSGQVAELYDGDAPLSGRLTFLTTLLSLATVPIWSVAGGRVFQFIMRNA